MQKTKKVRCIFTKIYGIDLLLNFEWNRFHICQYYKKRSYMLYKTLLVLTVYSTTYFLQNCFLRFRKSGMQCWTFLNKYFLVSIVELVNFILRKSIANSIA